MGEDESNPWYKTLWNVGKKALPYAATIYSGYQAHQAGRRSDDMARAQLEQAQREYAEREPLRRMGMEGVGQSENPYDLGTLSFDDQNPFARSRDVRPSNAVMQNRTGLNFSQGMSYTPTTPSGQPMTRPFVPPSDPLKGGDQSMYQNARPADPSQWEKDPVTGRWRHK